MLEQDLDPSPGSERIDEPVGVAPRLGVPLRAVAELKTVVLAVGADPEDVSVAQRAVLPDAGPGPTPLDVFGESVADPWPNRG
jgi:hypothetical protein